MAKAKADQKNLFVRIPLDTYQLLKREATERSLGSYINRAIISYANLHTSVSKAVVETLLEAGLLGKE